MEINIILLLILIEGTVTDSSNAWMFLGSVFGNIYDIVALQNILGSNPRGFAVFRQTEAVTYEPIDYPSPDEESRIGRQGPTPRRGNASIVLSDERGHRSLHGLVRTANGSSLHPARYNVTVLRVSEQTTLFLQGPLASYFIPIIYTLVFLGSVPLNAVAALTFMWCIRQKKPAAVYMSQLALADLLFGLLLPLKVHYYSHGSDWPFGEAACRVVTAAFYGYMNCSVLLLMCIGVDRVLAVAIPVASMRWRSARNAALVCAGAWLLALAGAAPLLSMQQTVPIGQVGVTCHDVLELRDPLYLGLFSSLACVFFLLPVAVTTTCYCVIIRALRPTKSLHGTSKWSSLSKKRKRAVAMVLAMVVEFVVCFAPTNVILLLHCVQQTSAKGDGASDGSYAAYILAVCMGSVSACLDPLLYYYGSSQCRRQISATMWWRRGKQAHISYHTQSTSLQSSNECYVTTSQSEKMSNV